MRLGLWWLDVLGWPLARRRTMFWRHCRVTRVSTMFRCRWSLRWRGMGRWWRSVNPALSLRVPGPANIVLIPVTGNTVGKDADTDHGTVADDWNIGSLIRVNNVGTVDPAPARSCLHITPAIVGHATLHGDWNTGQQDGNDRVLHPWPGAQIDLFGGVGQLGL